MAGARTPRLTVRLARQRIARTRAVRVSASCDSACSLRGTGKVTIARSGRSLPLRAAAGTLRAAGRKVLTLRFTRAALKKVLVALRAHRRVTAAVTVVARNKSGQSAALTRHVRLLR